MFLRHPLPLCAAHLLRACPLLAVLACAHLPPLAPGAAQPPYPTVASYFGYITPGTEPDVVADGVKLTVVYVRLPAATPGLAVRAVSPVGGLAQPRPGDSVARGYLAHADGPVAFDPSLRIERCVADTPPAPGAEEGCPAWQPLAESPELSHPRAAAQPRHTALVRVEVDHAQPLPAGLYRVGLTVARGSDVQGAFLLQVGAATSVSGIDFARPGTAGTRPG